MFHVSLEGKSTLPSGSNWAQFNKRLMNTSVHTLQEKLNTPAAMTSISSNESVHEHGNSFRKRFLIVKGSTSGDGEDHNRKIIDKRGAFKWLPVAYDNDIVYGSWYFVWGSFLCMIIPVFPLISIYQDLLRENHDDLGSSGESSKLIEQFSILFFLTSACIIIIAIVAIFIIIPIIICTIDIPTTENAVCYALLIFVGLMYTIGSYAMVLASKDPHEGHLFGGKSKYGFPYVFLLQTDELFGLW